MNIFVNDNAGFKFSQMIIDHWREKGHTVEQEVGANPEKIAEWADLTYIDFLDSNFYCYFNGPGGDNNAPDWKSYPKRGKIAVRAIDIDIWMGRHRDQRIWDYMDNMIVINPFYQEMVQREGNPPEGKLSLITPGVDLTKFIFREKPIDEYKIALVTGNMWEAKATFEAIRLVAMLRQQSGAPFTLHIRGQFISPEWHRVAHDHLIKTLGLEDVVTVYGPQGNMNDWYQDKDYILVTSYKEAFSYAAAEGMAVGLKPIINNFFGSTDIWSEEYLYTNLDDAISKFADPMESKKYRAFIEEKYSATRMFAEYDQLLGT